MKNVVWEWSIMGNPAPPYTRMLFAENDWMFQSRSCCHFMSVLSTQSDVIVVIHLSTWLRQPRKSGQGFSHVHLSVRVKWLLMESNKDKCLLIKKPSVLFQLEHVLKWPVFQQVSNRLWLLIPNYNLLFIFEWTFLFIYSLA